MGVMAVMIAVAVVLAVALVVVLKVTTQLIEICMPNELVVVSGRQQSNGDAFRIVAGGRTLRIPPLENAERISLNAIPIDGKDSNAYSKGNIPLSITFIASVAVSAEPSTARNAIERFLGRDSTEIARVAKETIEGHLRGVVSEHKPEELVADQMEMARKLVEECADDFAKLGLEIDVLLLGTIEDEVGYLQGLADAAIAQAQGAQPGGQ